MAGEVDAPMGVPAEDWDPGVEDRSLSRNEAVDEDRSLEGTLDCEEETYKDGSMLERLEMKRSKPDLPDRPALP